MDDKQAPKDHEWMTVKETADLLRVHINTIYEMVRRGEIPAYHIGRLIRINRTALTKAVPGIEE